MPVNVFKPNIERSFQSADIVFIGNVYDVNTSYKTGYWSVENSLSKVKIEKLYKSLGNDFKSTEITFFGQQFNSCDFIFLEKGKYLIFGYYDPDTTFFYTTHCSATKLSTDLNKNDYLLLDQLAKKKNNKSEESQIELIEFERYPDKEITNLKLSNQYLTEKNKKQKLWFIISTSFLLIIILSQIWLYRKKIRLIK